MDESKVNVIKLAILVILPTFVVRNNAIMPKPSNNRRMRILRTCSVIAVLFCLCSCTKGIDDPYIPSEWKYDRYSDAGIIPGNDFYRHVCGLGIAEPGADAWAPFPCWIRQTQDFSTLAYSEGTDNPVPVINKLNGLKNACASHENMEEAFARLRKRLSGIGDLTDISDYPQAVARCAREGYNFFYVQSQNLDGHKFGIKVTAIYDGLLHDWKEEWLKEAGIYDEYTRLLPKAREFEQYLKDNIADPAAKVADGAFGRFSTALGNANPDFVPTDDATRRYFEIIDGMGNDMLEAANAFLWCAAASLDINVLFEPETMANVLLTFMSPNLLMNISHTFCDSYTTAGNIRKNEEIFEVLRNTMIERIDRSEWMTPGTKTLAREKLEAMECHTGILDWERYEADMPVSSDFCSAFHEICSSYLTKLMDISGDNDNIDHIIAAAYMTPFVGYPAYDANSFYLRSCNTMCILPSSEVLWDMNPDFPFIMFVIAHEMCHGFDSEGCNYNARGECGDWWAAGDRLEFGKKKEQLTGIFNKYQVDVSIFCDGAKTIDEDMADLGGMEIAWHAAKKELEGKYRGDELLDMERRFFKSYAVFYAQHLSLEDKIKSVKEQVHSVNEYRVNGIVNNIDDWYSCFDVTSEQRFYLSPEHRVHFW